MGFQLESDVIKNDDILNPGNPNMEKTSTAGFNAVLGVSASETKSLKNGSQSSLEISLGIMSIKSDNQFMKLNIGTGLKAGLVMLGFELAGELGLKIRK